MYELKKDGKVIFEGTENECLEKLHDVHSGSWHNAFVYEGYSMEEKSVYTNNDKM